MMTMVSVARWRPSASHKLYRIKFTAFFDKPSLPSPSYGLFFSIYHSSFRSKASLKGRCTKNKGTDNTNESKECFSVLASEIPWEKGNIWSTMALYMFYLHIPLGYGGLSIVSYLLHQPVLDPQTQVLSLLVVQMLELIGTLCLLRSATKPQHKSTNFLKADTSRKERNWLLASVLGFGFLVVLIFSSSLLADKLVGSKAVTNPEVKRIIMSGNISRTACFMLYCAIAPLLEEIVYRCFLLTSLASTMNWNHALLISSAVFSAAHFSKEKFIQLFIVGCVLGSSYSWSGNVASSIVVHSLYNALTLAMTLLS